MSNELQSPPARNRGSCNVFHLLRVCATQKDLHRGSQLHAYIWENYSFEKESYTQNTLVDMYAKCGALSKAHQVLEELPVRNVVTWNAVIAGFSEQLQGEEALKCYDIMQWEGHAPDAITFTCVLKACGATRSLTKGEQIHNKIVSLGILGKNSILRNSLVDMYAKCGELSKAQQVFRQFPIRDVVTWNALIAGYGQYGQGEEALECYDNMQHEGLSPNTVTFIGALKACASIGAVAKGAEIHDHIVSLGMLKRNIELGATLVNMYAKCDALAKAKQVLEELPVRNVVTWNALIIGYAHQLQGKDALECFDSMQYEGHSPDSVTLIYVLKACATIGTASKGVQIHDMIVSSGMLEKCVMLGTALVDMYVKFGALNKAQQVLKELPVRNVVTWNALMAGYAEQGQGEEALKCYDGMQLEGHFPDAITFTCTLKACGSVGAITKGEMIHEKIVSLGILEKTTVVGNALMDMYGKCGAVVKAQQVLERLPVWDAVTWNVLLAGYVHHGHGEEAMKCFDRMQCEGYSPNVTTFVCALKACGNIGAAEEGEQIHDMIVSLGILEKNIELGSTLVDMYAKCGVLLKAQQVLEELPLRDVVTWSALMAGYVQYGKGEEALKCFHNMQHDGHCPNTVTFTCLLKACGNIGAAAKGKHIHDMIACLGMLENNVELGNALVDMYAKCAMLDKALKLFLELSLQDVVTWNALIGGYAYQGQIAEILVCLERMQYKGVRPDLSTLSCLLVTFSHSGLLDEGEVLFSRMSTEYGIMLDVEHFSCMIDLFSRAGKIKVSLMLIEKMPSAEYYPLWVALMGACYKWEEVKICRFAFERALHLNKNNAAVYMYSANMHTADHI